jgi:hypothetical protein
MKPAPKITMICKMRTITDEAATPALLLAETKVEVIIGDKVCHQYCHTSTIKAKMKPEISADIAFISEIAGLGPYSVQIETRVKVIAHIAYGKIVVKRLPRIMRVTD